MLWKCGVCGYVHDGDEAPDTCPKCGAPKEQFSKIESDAKELIIKSRDTNDLHMALVGIMEQAHVIAEEIKDENLDPNCVMIAERVMKDSWETVQSVKAELEAHMKKNKWG